MVFRAELFVKNLLQEVIVASNEMRLVGYNNELLVVHEHAISIHDRVKKRKLVSLLVVRDRLLQKLVPAIFLLVARNYLHAIEKILKKKFGICFKQTLIVQFVNSLDLDPKTSEHRSMIL